MLLCLHNHCQSILSPAGDGAPPSWSSTPRQWWRGGPWGGSCPEEPSRHPYGCRFDLAVGSHTLQPNNSLLTFLKFLLCPEITFCLCRPCGAGEEDDGSCSIAVSCRAIMGPGDLRWAVEGHGAEHPAKSAEWRCPAPQPPEQCQRPLKAPTTHDGPWTHHQHFKDIDKGTEYQHGGDIINLSWLCQPIMFYSQHEKIKLDWCLTPLIPQICLSGDC